MLNETFSVIFKHRALDAISAFSGKNVQRISDALALVQFDVRFANSFQYWDVLRSEPDLFQFFPADPKSSSRMSEIGQGLGVWIGKTPRINSSIDSFGR